MASSDNRIVDLAVARPWGQSQSEIQQEIAEHREQQGKAPSTTLRIFLGKDDSGRSRKVFYYREESLVCQLQGGEECYSFLNSYPGPGLYYLAWCVTFPVSQHINNSVRLKLRVHNTQNGRISIEGSWTVPPEKVRGGEPVRLILDRKVWLQTGFELHGALKINVVEADGEESTTAHDYKLACETATVHYFEAFPVEACSPLDIKVPSDLYVNVPLILNLPAAQDGGRWRIVSTEMSRDRKYAASLSTNGDHVALDLWDMLSIHSGHSGMPLASTRFELKDLVVLNLNLKVAISSDGSHIAIFEEPSIYEKWSAGKEIKGGQFPVRFFAYDTTFTPIDTTPDFKEKQLAAMPPTMAGVRTLNELKYSKHSPLSTFIGFASFQHRSPGIVYSTAPREHIFVTCNGLYMDIFDVFCGFQPMYTISLSEVITSWAVPSSKFEHCGVARSLMTTLHDTMFALNYGQEIIPIFNWRTGQVASYIKTEADYLLKPHLMAFSPDGSIFVLASNHGVVSCYSTQSGLMLSSSKVQMERVDRVVYLDDDRVLVEGLEVGSRKSFHRVMDVQYLSNYFDVNMLPMVDSTIVGIIQNEINSNRVGTAIVQRRATIEFLELELLDSNFHSVHPNCGVTCHEEWSVNPEQDRTVYDKEQDCTFRLTVKEYEGILRLAKISGSSGAEVEIMIEVLCADVIEYIQSVAILPCGQRFVVIRQRGFELWSFPTKQRATCKLLTTQTVPWSGYRSWFVCAHGSIMGWREEIEDVPEASQAGSKSGEEEAGDDDDGPPTHYVDISRTTFLGDEDTIGFIEMIPTIMKYFSASGSAYQESVIEILMRHINRHPGHNDAGGLMGDLDPFKTSVIGQVVKNCRIPGSENFLRSILESTKYGHWVPHPSEFSAEPLNDLIACLIVESKVTMAQLVIEYLLARAHTSDSGYLDLLMVSIPHILASHPEIAFDLSRRAAFVPVKERSFLVQNASVNIPQWRLKWNPVKRTFSAIGTDTDSQSWLSFRVAKKVQLHEFMDQNPVFQLPSQLNLAVVKGGSHLFSRTMIVPHIRALDDNNTEIKAKFYIIPISLLWSVESRGSKKKELDRLSSTSVPWVQQLLRLVSHFINPLDTLWVNMHFSDLEVFENLAITAIMKYKWSRMASFVWTVRFVFQVAYEALVLAVTFLQLYGDGDQRGAPLTGGYIGVIVLGYTLLHLEFQQMRGGFGRYFSSPYNYVDLATYSIPLVASCILLASPDNIYCTRALSFSIVLVYMHFIFELRVFRSVCKVVTIVVNILLEIPAFFVILAIFILSFAHSINHLTEVNYRLTECLPNDDGSVPTCQTLRNEFPISYMQSVSASYFFMTGNYGPVSTSLTDGHWTSQLMVGLYFFLTAVLMMNVVIALMNGAYSDAVIVAQQTWLKNRLDLIASAENLSFYLPSFRERHDIFPTHVFYTATDKQIRDFRAKFELDDNPLKFDFSKPAERIGSVSGLGSYRFDLSTAVGDTTISNTSTTIAAAVATAVAASESNTLTQMKRIVENELQESLKELHLRISREKQMYYQDMEIRLAKDRQETEARFLKERQESEQRVLQMVEGIKATLVAQLLKTAE